MYKIQELFSKKEDFGNKAISPIDQGWMQRKLDEQEMEYLWKCIDNKKCDFKFYGIGVEKLLDEIKLEGQLFQIRPQRVAQASNTFLGRCYYRKRCRNWCKYLH